MKKIFLFLIAMALTCGMHAKTLTLDWNHPLNPTSFTYDAKGMWTGTYNEDDYYTIDFPGMSFAHEAWADYGFWYGFTVANSSDTTYATMADQFRCVAGGGLAGKGTPYVIAYAMEGMGPTSPCEVYFTANSNPWLAEEVYLCNESWALHNMTVGGAGHTFAAGDSLVVIIEGLDDSGEAIQGKQVTYFLADYRSANEADWTLNRGWEKVDLTALGEVYGLRFTLKTSDVGEYGSNTALYFALDGLKIWQNVPAGFENEAGGINLTVAESQWQGADAPVAGTTYAWQSGDYTFHTEAASWGGYSLVTVTNETSNEFTGLQDAYRSAKGGAYEGSNFAVTYVDSWTPDTVFFEARVVPGFFINNTAYAVNSMSNGDTYAKKFAKDDWFKLTITGQKEKVAGKSVDFYLAQDGKYVAEWTYVDLSELGEIDAVTFSMSSTDNGDWGMNTPSYFAMDNFGAKKPADYVAPEMAEFPADATAIDQVNEAVKVVKVVHDNQVVIIREGKTFNVLGIRF